MEEPIRKNIEYDEIRICYVSCFNGPQDNKTLVFHNKFDEIEEILQNSEPIFTTSYTTVSYYKDGIEVDSIITDNISDFEKLGDYEVKDFSIKTNNTEDEEQNDKPKKGFFRRLFHL